MIVREGVVLLHGHGRFGASMALLARAARRAGYATLVPSYPYRRSLGEIAAWLAPRVAAFEKEFDGPLHIVTALAWRAGGTGADCGTSAGQAGAGRHAGAAQ